MHINRDVLQFKTIPLLTIGPAESWTFFSFAKRFHPATKFTSSRVETCDEEYPELPFQNSFVHIGNVDVKLMEECSP